MAYFEKLQCKNCGPNGELIEDDHAGDTICIKCGFVALERSVDVGAEWRTFRDNPTGNDRSRVGPADDDYYGNNILGSYIQFGQDIGVIPAGAATSTHEKRPVFKRRSTHSMVSLSKSLDEIRSICDRLHLDQSIMNQAKDVHKKVNEGKWMKGRSNTTTAAACVFIACKRENVPRAYREICGGSEAQVKEVTRGVRHIMSCYSREHTHKQPTPNMESTHKQPTPSMENTHKQPTPNMENTHKQPTPSMENTHKQPTPSMENTHKQPTSSWEDTHIQPTLRRKKTHKQPATTLDYMARFCGLLGLPRKFNHVAIKVADGARGHLMNRSPLSVAAAALYLATQASDSKRSAQEVSEASGVAVSTIVNLYKMLLPEASSLFPEDFIFTTPIEQLPSQ